VSNQKAAIRIPAVIETSLPLSPVMLPDLRALLWQCAGIVRTRDGIQAGLDKLDAMQREPVGLLPYGQALRARNIHDAAHLILHSAALRKESRGGHFNTDYPERTLPVTTVVDGAYRKCWAPSQRDDSQVEAFLHA